MLRIEAIKIIAAALCGTTSAENGRQTRRESTDRNGKEDFTSHSYHGKMLDQYIAIWDGDVSHVNSTFAPEMTVYIDRFPTGSHGTAEIGPSVTSPATFADFVQKTRSGLREYTINVRKWAGEDYNIALRRTLHIVLGDDFQNVPTTLKSGDSVSYNGTKWFTLDPCTGLVKEVESAQDLITFMYNLGNDINLTPL